MRAAAIGTAFVLYTANWVQFLEPYMVPPSTVRSDPWAQNEEWTLSTAGCDSITKNHLKNCLKKNPCNKYEGKSSHNDGMNKHSSAIFNLLSELFLSSPSPWHFPVTSNANHICP